MYPLFYRAVGCMWFTLLWPIWPFIFEVILFGYWGATAVFLASSGYPRYGLDNATVSGICLFHHIPLEWEVFGILVILKTHNNNIMNQ